MPSSNALDPQSPQARAIYDLGIVSALSSSHLRHRIRSDRLRDPPFSRTRG